MKLIKIFSGIVLLIFIACDKNAVTPIADDGYFVFGSFYGECEGEGCIEIFRLEENQLSEDTLDNYPSADFYQGKYVTLTNDKFEMAKDLPGFMPDKLFDENEKIIGAPDAGDWGGIYVEYNNDNIRKFWLIDQKKDNVPSYLHAFIDAINEKIGRINE